jgi:small subunit ribosomal protein S6e
MFKINISEKSGKTYKLEAEAEGLIEKSLHDKALGEEILPDLKGYEFEITGASDKAGFTAMENVEGVGLKRVLLTYGKAMHKRPRREGKKKVSNPKPKGLRMRKTVRGQVISPEIIQINLKTLKEGAKKLSEIFPEQNKAPEPEVKSEEVPKEVAPKEEKPVEQEAVKQVPAEQPQVNEPEKSAESQSDSENKESINNENPEPSGEANLPKE